jgi:cyclophilin family peptidyl-prolyl cis-trans isomerase
MIPRWRLSTFCIAVAVAASTACAPLNRAKVSLSAASDTLAATRDSLRNVRAALAHRDSVFMPLDFATPDSFVVAFETTKGRFDVMAHRRWAPVGVDRFYELVHRRFYDSVFFHRVVKGFVAQFGMNGAQGVGAAWSGRRLADDPPRESNTRGRISFARSGPASRTTQLFINFGNNARLDSANAIGYPPFGEVVRGIEVVDSLNSEYGSAPNARGDSLQAQGNSYFLRAFPNLDMIKTARVIQEWRRSPR